MRVLSFIALVSLLYSVNILAKNETDDPVEIKGVFHRAHPAAKKFNLDTYNSMNDNDILEQIDVYSAYDASSSLAQIFADENLNITPVHVISRSQIVDSGSNNLLDILRMAPGIQIVENINGYEISSRGLRSNNRIKIIIDGSEVQDVFTGFQFGEIDAGLIEQVEIYNGPDAVLGGVNVISAVVNVVLKKNYGLSINFKKGSFSNYSGSAILSQKVGSSKHYIGISASSAQNEQIAIIPDYYLSGIIGNRILNDTSNKPRHSVSAFMSSDFLVIKKLDSHLAVNAELLWEKRGKQLNYNFAEGSKFDLNRLDWSGKVKWDILYGKQNVFEMQTWVGQNYVNNFYQLSYADSNLKSEKSALANVDDGVDLNRKYRTLNLGFALKNKSNLFAGNFLTVDSRIEVGGLIKDSFHPLFLNGDCLIYGDEWRLFDVCRMILSGAVLDEWQIDRHLKLWGGFRLFSFSDFSFAWHNNFYPKAGIMITPSNNWIVKLVFSQGLRLPTLEDKFDNSISDLVKITPASFQSNELLKPEKSRMIELNIAYVETYQQIKYFMQLSGHITKVTDAIEKFATSLVNYRLENNVDYLILGSGANAEVSFADGSYLFFNLSWYRAYWQKVDISGNWLCKTGGSLSPNSQNSCQEISSLPRLKMSAGVNVMLGSWASLFCSLELGSERNSDELTEFSQAQIFNLSPYTLVNLSIKSKPIFGYLTLQGSVFNLFNFHNEYDALLPGIVSENSGRSGSFFYLGANVSI